MTEDEEITSSLFTRTPGFGKTQAHKGRRSFGAISLTATHRKVWPVYLRLLIISFLVVWCGLARARIDPTADRTNRLRQPAAAATRSSSPSGRIKCATRRKRAVVLSLAKQAVYRWAGRGRVSSARLGAHVSLCTRQGKRTQSVNCMTSELSTNGADHGTTKVLPEREVLYSCWELIP